MTHYITRGSASGNIYKSITITKYSRNIVLERSVDCNILQSICHQS